MARQCCYRLSIGGNHCIVVQHAELVIYAAPLTKVLRPLSMHWGQLGRMLSQLCLRQVWLQETGTGIAAALNSLLPPKQQNECAACISSLAACHHNVLSVW